MDMKELLDLMRAGKIITKGNANEVLKGINPHSQEFHDFLNLMQNYPKLRTLALPKIGKRDVPSILEKFPNHFNQEERIKLLNKLHKTQVASFFMKGLHFPNEKKFLIQKLINDKNHFHLLTPIFQNPLNYDDEDRKDFYKKALENSFAAVAFLSSVHDIAHDEIKQLMDVAVKSIEAMTQLDKIKGAYEKYNSYFINSLTGKLARFVELAANCPNISKGKAPQKEMYFKNRKEDIIKYSIRDPKGFYPVFEDYFTEEFHIQMIDTLLNVLNDENSGLQIWERNNRVDTLKRLIDRVEKGEIDVPQEKYNMMIGTLVAIQITGNENMFLVI